MDRMNNDAGKGIRLIVAGSRGLNDYQTVKTAIDDLASRGMVISAIIEGTALGVDRLASRYAVEHGIENIRVPAEWNLYHRGAGVVRNRKMAEMGDALLALWDGKSRGTRDMIKAANSVGIPVTVVYVNPSE